MNEIVNCDTYIQSLSNKYQTYKSLFRRSIICLRIFKITIFSKTDKLHRNY